MKVPHRISRGNHFFFLMCAIGAFAILSSTMSKNPVLPLFAESLGVRGVDLGLVAAASTIPGILVSLPAGSLSDVFGRRKVILTSLMVFATAPFLYLLVREAWQLAIVRFYHGFATAIFGPVANATIAERYPGRRGERISTFSSATVVGRSIAPFLGGSILYVANFASLYLAVGASAITALVIGVMLYREVGASRRVDVEKKEGVWITSKIVASIRAVATSSKVLATSFVEASQLFTFGAFEFFLVLYAQSVGLDSLQIGAVSGAQLVSVVVTKPLMGWVSDRIGRKRVISSGLILGGVPLLLTPFAAGFLSLLLVSMLYGLSFSMVTSSTAAYVSDLTAKESYGLAMGFLSTIMDVGQTLGPIITGAMVASFNYTSAFQVLGLTLFLSCAVFLVMRSVDREPCMRLSGEV